MSWYNQPLNQQIGQYIYNGAVARGLDPNYILGIATHEGLNRTDPLIGNQPLRALALLAPHTVRFKIVGRGSDHVVNTVANQR